MKVTLNNWDDDGFWLTDHGENRYIILAADGYYSYYREYEEYFQENETPHFCEQITLVAMILLSRYRATAKLYKSGGFDEEDISVAVDVNNLAGVANNIFQALQDDDYSFEIYFSTASNKEFMLAISPQLGASFTEVPKKDWQYIGQLIEKVGLSSFLERD